MPLYDFRCEVCGRQEELYQGLNEPLPVCCEKEMKRLISNPMFVLNGTCWSKDGYANKIEN